MVLPILIYALVAGGAALITYGGVAVSNWTQPPEQVIYDSGGNDSYSPTVPTAGEINPVLVIGGLVAAAFMLKKK